MPDQITKRNISEMIVAKIVRSIEQGDFIPGSRLPSESALMERFQVGRSSVREAMQALSIMGVVTIRPGQGTFIRADSKAAFFAPEVLAPLVDEEVTQNLAEAREVLEPIIAELAAKRATTDDLCQIQELLYTCERHLKINEPLYELSAEFHLLIAQASHNIFFLRLLQSIIGIMAARGARIEENRAFLQWELESHIELFLAISAGDGLKSKELMTTHIQSSAMRYLDMRRESEEIDR